MKTAIIVLSDPKSGSDEALGRVFNALATAFELKQTGADVTLQFQGAGTRWPLELTKPEHPAHALFNAISDTIQGASCGCADVFGATEDLTRSGFELIKDNPIPGTNGVASIANLQKDGRQIITF